MSLEKHYAIVEALKEKGIEASVEYPGFVHILHPSGDGTYLAYGDSNDMWGADYCEADGNVSGSSQSEVFTESDDVQAAIDFILQEWELFVHGFIPVSQEDGGNTHVN